jgi:NTE family protein
MAVKKTSPVTEEKKKVNLALQGGGAHGAFTWGVLDAILQENKLDIEAITATSAGAVNAVVMSYGLLVGGEHKARELLHSFWHKVSVAASMSPMQPSLMEKVFGPVMMEFSPSFMAMDLLTRVFSPYQLNMMDYNPLRDILDELVDFKVLREQSDIKLFITATHVRTGKPRIFTHDELTLDMVMASTCLPFIYKTVEIDGEPYWDGGYSGNPALFPLFYQATSQDILLVQINPLYVEQVPTGAAQIMDRVNEISFNASLLREMRAIEFVARLVGDGVLDNHNYKQMRMHMIDAEDLMGNLGYSTKLNADWDFLQHLFEIGKQTASDWQKTHVDAIGVRSTLDMREMFL